MFQVTFSDQAMEELNKIDVEAQMRFVERISNISPEQLANPQEPLGRFSRKGKIFYRLRAGDFRCYFTVEHSSLNAHYILTKHSTTDFLFRFKLPVSQEQLIEQHQSFWKYLESLAKK